MEVWRGEQAGRESLVVPDRQIDECWARQMKKKQSGMSLLMFMQVQIFMCIHFKVQDG